MSRRASSQWSAPDQQHLETDMDRLSLQQALVDFEIANRRVIDLTNRLVEALEENRRLKRELELMRVRHFIASRVKNLGPVRRLAKRVAGGSQGGK